MSDIDKYAAQKTLFGDTPAVPHAVGFREELHARERDNIPNPNRHPGQFAPKGGSNPLLKVVETDEGWIASAVLKDGKEFRVYGHDRRDAISNAVRTGEKMGVIFDPPKAEPKIGGLFNSMHPREVINHGAKHAGQFAPKIHPIVEQETERYLRHNGIDVERYGMGRNVMKLLMSVLAMHAMNHVMSRQSQASPQKPKPAQQSSPSNQDFEKLHPRAQTPGSGQKPGQFTSKPESQRQPSPPPQPRPVRPLTERPDKKAQLSQSPPTQQQQQQEQPAPVTPKPWLAAPGTPKPDVTEYDRDPRRGTPEQKAARMEQMKARDAGPQKPPVQTPKDANTARIAEIWDVDATVPSTIPPAVPAPQAHTVESFTADVLGKLKTQPAGPNPRKKILPDGSDNPDYNPQNLGMGKLPVAEKPAKPTKPSLLDMPAQSSDGDIFQNPAAKARKEKAELDRITRFDVNDFAEPEGEEEFAGGEEFDVPAPTEDQFDTPEQLQKMQDYRARRPSSEDPQELAEWRKTKPETYESAMQKWNAKRYRLNSKNKKAVQDDPEENIYQAAEQNEFLPEQFKAHIEEMQRFEQGEWERREKVKSNILKAWNTDRSTLKRMENRNQDHSNLLGADQLKGSVDDSDLYEFLGSDDGEWAQNAWAMVREDTPPKPGAHDKDWINGHVEEFKRQQSMSSQSQQEYDAPEDGMPFSKRSLNLMVDRYFRQEQLRFHGKRSQTAFSFWTALDFWL
jgi:hypothetical protein